MIQLNLLPNLKKEYLQAQKTKNLVITSSIFITIGALGISALFFVYVTFLQQVQINLASDDITKKTNELKSIEDIDKYLTIQNQLQALPGLHEAKGAYSRLFDFVSVVNPGAPNNINLTNLQLIAEEKSVIFTGTTASFETFNVFVDTLKNAEVSYKPGGEGDLQSEKMFSPVQVQSSGLTKIGSATLVSFIVKATYPDSVFDVRNTEVTAKVPSITTTQSVTQSPKPVQLFNGEAQ